MHIDLSFSIKTKRSEQVSSFKSPTRLVHPFNENHSQNQFELKNYIGQVLTAQNICITLPKRELFFKKELTD